MAPAIKPAAGTKRASAANSASVAKAGKVRIVGGVYKRTPLTVPSLDGLRPTPDRVREALFNWLGSLPAFSVVGSRCLDLFAGTGALGIEAASRGAGSVVLVESQAKAQAVIRDTLSRLKNPPNLKLVAQTAEQFLAGKPGAFDIVFLDPPFGAHWLEKLQPHLPALLSPNGLVYAESDSEQIWSGWDVIKHGKAGQVYYSLLRPSSAPT